MSLALHFHRLGHRRHRRILTRPHHPRRETRGVLSLSPMRTHRADTQVVWKMRRVRYVSTTAEGTARTMMMLVVFRSLRKLQAHLDKRHRRHRLRDAHGAHFLFPELIRRADTRAAWWIQQAHCASTIAICTARAVMIRVASRLLKAFQLHLQQMIVIVLFNSKLTVLVSLNHAKKMCKAHHALVT